MLLKGSSVHEAVGHALDLVVDPGRELTGTETTVVSMIDGEVEVIREGAGPLDDL